MSCLEAKVVRFPSNKYGNLVPIRAIPGHFATTHSHVNYFIDLSAIKARQTEAEQCARVLALQFVHQPAIDTIVCLDDTDVIGAYMAQVLAEAGDGGKLRNDKISVIHPEYVANGQMLFRDNMEPLLRDKKVLLLMASVTTGISVRRGISAIEYYGGKVQGGIAIFSAVDHVGDLPITTLYTASDICGYASYSRKDCPYCKNGEPLEALVNSFGYSKL